MPRIKNFRISFVWIDTIPGLLDNQAPDSEFAWLSRRGDFTVNFDNCQAGRRAGGGLAVPWLSPDSGRSFWRYYFEDKRLSRVTGNQAWKKLAPLRQDLYRIAPRELDFSELRLSAYCYAHGIALALTLNARGVNLEPLAVAKRAVALRREQLLVLPDQPRPRFSLDVLHKTVRDRLHEEQFQSLDFHSGRNQPYSVVTILEADDVDPTSTVTEGDDTHRALEAMTVWNPYFEATDLNQSPIASARVEGRKRLDSDLLYARDTGVAVWLPRELASGRKGLTALSCYHNNLLHGSMQVRSLAEFVHWTRRKTANGGAVSNAISNRAERSARLLQMIRSGDYATYRSRCLEKVIDQSLGDTGSAVQ